MSYDPNQPPPYTPGPPQYGPPPQPYQPPAGYPPPQQYQPGYGPPPNVPPMLPFGPPPPKKTWTPAAIIAVSVAGVALLCGGIAALTDSGSKDSGSTASVTTKKPGVTAAAEKAAPADNPTPGGAFNVVLGSTITADDGNGNIIEATLRSVRAVKKTCSSIDNGPENGLYVIVNVLVVQKKGKGSVNPLDFTFVADDGTSNNELTGGFSGCEKPSLDAADLRAGQKRAGEMAFDVNSKKGSLEWAPGGIGADTVGSWKTS